MYMDFGTRDQNMHHTYMKTDLSTADPIWSKMKKNTVLFAIGFIMGVCGGIAAYFIVDTVLNESCRCKGK